MSRGRLGRRIASMLPWLLALSAHAADSTPTREPIETGLLWWPAEAGAALDARHHDLEACLTARIGEVAPDVRVRSQRELRDLLFPRLEPATQPATEADFAALLTRADVRARLAQHGLRYLVVFSGRTTDAPPGGFVLCGAGPGGGGCLGFAWRGESTQLNAALWALDDATLLAHEDAAARGTNALPALGLPLPIAARTQAAACRDLGERLAQAMRRAAGR
jgi:hypothetical protein